MKVILALATLLCFSQAYGYGAGQAVTVDVEDTKVCQDCMNFFKDIQQIVQSANTTDQIVALVDQMLCSQLGSLEGMCKDLVKQYVPMFLQQLAGMEDPRQICGILGMCTQEMLKLGLKPQTALKGEECDLCKAAITEMKDAIRNQQTQTELKDFIENSVCPVLGQFAAQCKQEVEAYAALVFQLLENEMDPVVVCQALGLCTKKQEVALSRIGLTSAMSKVKVFRPLPKVMKAKKVKASTECVLCEFVMNEVDQILGNNRTEASIEAALKKVCSILPSTISQECVSFIEQYGQAIINLLLQELTPQEVCTGLGLCKSVRRRMPGEGPACVLCEFIMNEVDSYIGQNKSQANVEAALEKVCGLMPSTISAECKMFVQAYGPAIINLLVQELDPKAVCNTLRLCTGTNKNIVHHPVALKLSASTHCVLCEFVAKELDTLLMDNATAVEIQAALDKVCSILPSTVKSQCLDFINTYSPAILQILVQELDPQVICTTLGLCSPARSVRKVSVKAPLKDEMCTLCTTVLNYAVALLKENSTVEDVEMVLDKVCNFLGAALKDQCDQFVQDYAPLVVNLLANDIDPRQICEQMKLCNASRTVENKGDNKLLFKPGLLGQDECTFGPSFWCDSKENAIRCGTVEHCTKHVWN